MMDLSRSPRIETLMASIDAIPGANAKLLIGLFLGSVIVLVTLGLMALGFGARIVESVLLILLTFVGSLIGVATWRGKKDDERAAATPIKPEP